MPGQLTLWEREQIAQFRNRGWSRAKIARQLKRHPATIGRELTRNSDGDRYWASVAEEKAAARRQRRPRKLHDPRPSEYVRAGCAKRWPLAVVFAVRPATGAAGKTREIAGPGPDRGPAGHRGPETTVRRLGGRYGRRQGTSQRVVTLVDRKSGFALVAKVQRLKAHSVVRALQRQVAPLPDGLRHTATFDNGKEFAAHEQIARTTNIDIYFARPYHAWERGCNESFNELLRQFFPKGTDFAGISRKK